MPVTSIGDTTKSPLGDLGGEIKAIYSVKPIKLEPLKVSEQTFKLKTMRLLNIKLAIRNALKDRVLSFAKLFGLSISFAIILFAVAYVYYETSFDKFVPDHKKIYRCLMQGQLNGNDADFAVTSSKMAKVVLAEIPEITEVVRLATRGEASINYNTETIEMGTLFFADPEFFSFFDFKIYKNTDNPFESPDNISIAESVARQYFGSPQEALGKVVQLRGQNSVITGVFEDLPSNFHLQTKIIQSIDEINPHLDGWGSQNYYTYIKTSSDISDLDDLNFKLTKTVYSHYDDGIDGASATNWEDLKYAENTHIFFNAEPLTDIHFGKHRFDPAITSNKIYVYGAIILAVLILLISSFNFINLTIANLSTRVKEIGIRKTNGAANKQITQQFIFESVWFWVTGFGIAIMLYYFGETPLNRFLGLEVNIEDKTVVLLLIFIFAGLLIFNLITNILPVTFFSRKETLHLIKKESTEKHNSLLKDGFVVLQFVLSALIILCSIFVQKQINYMVNKERGYDKENIITMSMWSMAPETRRTFIEEISKHSAILSVSTSDVYFGYDPSMNGAFFETVENENYFHTSILPVDVKFFNTFNIQLKEGRFFDKERQTDFQAALLNETAANEYRKEGSLIGKKLHIDGTNYDIIGIVKDFNYRSLYHALQPLVITRIENLGNVFVKVRGNQIPVALELIRNQRKELGLMKPLQYSFHDDIIAGHYLKDQQAKKMLLFLSFISVLIACVGLYAISFFSIIKRTKEIGIRKVNGAKVSEILKMLNKDFVTWVAIAFVIACPIAYYTMNKWLENFAYKTNLSWWIFALAGILALGIATLTVSWQSWRAATKNPVEALRYE